MRHAHMSQYHLGAITLATVHLLAQSRNDRPVMNRHLAAQEQVSNAAIPVDVGTHRAA
jgi:hypothetical protein